MPGENQGRQDSVKPVITFSSFEEEEFGPEEEAGAAATGGARKATLRKTNSLIVPAFDLEQEAKRPPL